MPATPLPNAVTTDHLDSAADDPAQARAELLAGLAAVNTLRSWASWLFGSDGEKATAISNLGVSTSPTVSAKTGNFTATSDDNILYIVTPSGDSAVCTLPATGSTTDGVRILVKNNTDGKSVTISRAGSDTIDGATSIRVPGRALIELTKTSSGVWVVTRKGDHLVGQVIEWRTNTLPDGGYIWANGVDQSRSTLAGLFAIYGTTHGVGNGSTTFGIPDDMGYVKAGREGMGSATAPNRLQKAPTITTTNGNPSATVSAATDLCIGMYIFSANVTAGTTITAISGTTITMSANATGSGTGTAARFSLINDPQGITGVGGQQSAAQASSEIATHLHDGSGMSAGNGGAHEHTTKKGGDDPPTTTFNTGAISGGGANGGNDSGPINAASDHTHPISGNTGNAGSSNPMKNVQPTKMVNWIIKT